jgi:hypothetical protein
LEETHKAILKGKRTCDEFKLLLPHFSLLGSLPRGLTLVPIR